MDKEKMNGRELTEKELEQVSGGKHIEPIDGVYHFTRGKSFVEYLDPEVVTLICQYICCEDKYATIDETVYCHAEVYYGGQPMQRYDEDVSVAKLVECEIIQ